MKPYSLLANIFISILTMLISTASTHGAQDERNQVDITEWKVPWENTRPRDPYVRPRFFILALSGVELGKIIMILEIF